MYYQYQGPEPESPARPDGAPPADASQESAPGARGEEGELTPLMRARPERTPRKRARPAPSGSGRRRWADASFESAPAPGADAPQGSAPGAQERGRRHQADASYESAPEARRGRADASKESAPGTSGGGQVRPTPPPYRPLHPSGDWPGVTPPGVGTQRLSGLVPKRNNEPAQDKRRSELRAVAEAMGPSGSEDPGGRSIEPPPAYDDPRLRAAEGASPALERATVE